MCMISLPINEVTNTNIFVALSDNKKQQLTIYSNLIDNQINSNAMVIPVPNPESIQLHDMSKNKSFFSDCDKSFELISRSRSKSFNARSNSSNIDSYNVLHVKNIGSYKVSVAMNLEELNNIDKNVFVLSDELKNILSLHYNNKNENWGFIVFVLDLERKEYHPFAFSHNIFNNQIYIPTRHYHAHSKFDPNISIFDSALGFMNYIASNIDASPMFSGMTSKFTNHNELNKLNTMKQKKINILDQTMTDDWSHKIYLYNLNNNTITNANTIHQLMTKNYKYEWDNTTKFNKNSFNDFQMNNNIGFTKFDILGLHPNNDILIDIKA